MSKKNPKYLKKGGAEPPAKRSRTRGPEEANTVANKVVTDIAQNFTLLRGFVFPEQDEFEPGFIYIDVKEWNDFIKGGTLITLLFVYDVVKSKSHCVTIVKKGQDIAIFDPNHKESRYTFHTIELQQLDLPKRPGKIKATGIVDTVQWAMSTLTSYVSLVTELFKPCQKPPCPIVLGECNSQPQTFDEIEAAEALMAERQPEAGAAEALEAEAVLGKKYQNVKTYFLQVNGSWPHDTEGICVSLSLVFFYILREAIKYEKDLIDEIEKWMRSKIQGNQYLLDLFDIYWKRGEGGEYLLFPIELVQEMMKDMNSYMDSLATEPQERMVPRFGRSASATTGGRRKKRRKSFTWYRK